MGTEIGCVAQGGQRSQFTAGVAGQQSHSGDGKLGREGVYVPDLGRRVEPGTRGAQEPGHSSSCLPIGLCGQ